MDLFSVCVLVSHLNHTSQTNIPPESGDNYRVHKVHSPSCQLSCQVERQTVATPPFSCSKKTL